MATVTEGVTVWAVRLGTLDEGAKGRLELGPNELVFTAEKADLMIRIPLAEIRLVRRTLGSPVMVVKHGGSAVAFYFAEPPRLRFAGESSRRPRDRVRSITYLAGRNPTKRDQVKVWVRRIRDAARAAGGL
jgi:hypothetical protein